MGSKAEKFISENQDKLVEITPGQQKRLFEVTYAELEKDVKQISNLEKNKDRYDIVDFDTLNPKIKDVLVDLRYRGDYIPKSRDLVQKHIANNDLNAFKSAVDNEY